jgi:CheY-specific phosphatase CheX
MSNEFRQAAVSATLNIFETMFFTFLDQLDDARSLEDSKSEIQGQESLPSEDSPGLNLKTEIRFSGQRSGSLVLTLPYELGETLAMNFLGFEEEVTEMQILDMASELANMICGNMFSQLDKSAVYVLGSPLTQKMSHTEILASNPTADITLAFQTEGQKATVQLQFDPIP